MVDAAFYLVAAYDFVVICRTSYSSDEPNKGRRDKDAAHFRSWKAAVAMDVVDVMLA